MRQYVGEETERTDLLLRPFCHCFTVLWRVYHREKTTEVSVLFEKERRRWCDESS